MSLPDPRTTCEQHGRGAGAQGISTTLVGGVAHDRCRCTDGPSGQLAGRARQLSSAATAIAGAGSCDVTLAADGLARIAELGDADRYRPVRMDVKFLPDTILFADNRISDGKAGYGCCN